MGAWCPASSFLPDASTLPLQWAAAASLSAPLANLSAAVAGPLEVRARAAAQAGRLVRAAVGRRAERRSACRQRLCVDVFATSVNGRSCAAGRRARPSRLPLDARDGGHRGGGPCRAARWASTPHFGIVTPATGLGIEAVGRDARQACATSKPESRPCVCGAAPRSAAAAAPQRATAPSPIAASVSPAVGADQKPCAPCSAGGVTPVSRTRAHSRRPGRRPRSRSRRSRPARWRSCRRAA